HVGVLVGEGEFPREQSMAVAKQIFAAIPATSKGSALSLSADVRAIEHIVAGLSPPRLHLGGSAHLLTPENVVQIKKKFKGLCIMRSIPVVGEASIAIAKSYDGIADILLLDSHRPADRQIGALGVTHSWELDRKIVESVRTPVIIAGGLGSDNDVAAIEVVSPAGVDSKTKTDKDDESHTKDFEKVRQFVSLTKSCHGDVKAR